MAVCVNQYLPKDAMELSLAPTGNVPEYPGSAIA